MLKLTGLTYSFFHLNPILSNQQMKNHYEGHYLNYIAKTNNIIQNNNKLQKLLKLILKKENDEENIHNIFFICCIENNKLFNITKKDLNILSQAYFHEIFFKGLTSKEISQTTLNEHKKVLFKSNDKFNQFYNNYIAISNNHFASGWIWFIYDENANEIIVKDTQDAESPNFDMKNVLMCIDIWEHAYYTEYAYNRGEYVKNVFDLINWEFVSTKII